MKKLLKFDEFFKIEGKSFKLGDDKDMDDKSKQGKTSFKKKVNKGIRQKMKREVNRELHSLDESNENSLVKGRLVEIEPVENGLWVYMTKEGKKEFKEKKYVHYDLTEDRFYDFFEDIGSNSEWMYHFDMGEAGFGLTNAPGFTDGYYVDDDGNITDEGQEKNSEVYWFPNYMVESFTDTLKKDGKVFFTKADKE